MREQVASLEISKQIFALYFFFWEIIVNQGLDTQNYHSYTVNKKTLLKYSLQCNNTVVYNVTEQYARC